jgi:2-polyprenyl-3-methyl-5-hydroxy-6-metoxy-1,4-benzoquinol methylase
MKLFFGKSVSDEFIEAKLNWDSSNSVKKTAKKLSKIANTKIKKCYVCQSSKSKKVCQFYDINYVQCTKCKLVYTDRIVSEEGIKSYYKKNSAYFTEPYLNKNQIKLRNDLILPKIKFVKKFAKGKNWLDVGSADGATPHMASKEGFNSLGIEISEKSVAFAKKFRKIDLYSKTLETFQKENKKKWDVVSFFGIIDLVPNPLEFLEIANGLLNKNGIVVIHVPNYNSGSTLVQKLVKEPARHLKPPLNFKLFDIKTVEYALKETGFTAIAAWYYGMDMIELIKYIRNMDKKFKNSEIDKFLCKNLNELQLIFDKESMGDMVTVIGKKKK